MSILRFCSLSHHQAAATRPAGGCSVCPPSSTRHSITTNADYYSASPPESSVRARSRESTIMADPKYSSLPGIDIGSPDVYETTDLPEEDQSVEELVDDHLYMNSVEPLPINTKMAYSKFEGKQVNVANADFSGRIREYKNTGYDVSQSEYELLEHSSQESETPQQKYQRLQHEIRELAEDVTKIKDTVKSDTSTEQLTPVQFGKQLDYLQHQLGELHLEKLLGPEFSVDLSDPQGALRKRLLTQLEAYNPASKTPVPDGKTAEHVSYELYYRPEQAQFSRNARVASIEERLERLEAVIGNNREKLNVLTADTDNKSLLGAVSTLNSKLSLLNISQLDKIDGRVQNVLQKLSQINEKQTPKEEDTKQSTVSELYEIVKKWEGVADSWPQIVERLTTLKDIHEQALQFSQALAYMDTAQQEIVGTLNKHGDMMKDLQAAFKANTDVIKRNCESLDARINALKKT